MDAGSVVVVPRVVAAVVPAVVAGAVSVTPSTRCCTAAAEVVSVTEVGSPTGVLPLPWEEKYTISPRAMMADHREQGPQIFAFIFILF